MEDIRSKMQFLLDELVLPVTQTWFLDAQEKWNIFFCTFGNEQTCSISKTSLNVYKIVL